jgi:ABC-2 type transport system permease protein
MLNPLGMMVVLTLVFSQLFTVTKAYPAYVLAGILAWTFFARASSDSMRTMVWGGSLVRRIYVPKTLFALSATGTQLFNLVLSLVPLTAVLLVTGLRLTPAVLFLPVSLLILAAFSFGVGLLLSTIAVYFPDFAEMYDVVLPAWFYLTPIIYPLDALPPTMRALVVVLNPMYPMIEIFRQPILNGTLPPPNLIAASAVFALMSLTVGWVVFTRKLDEFAYRV